MSLHARTQTLGRKVGRGHEEKVTCIKKRLVIWNKGEMGVKGKWKRDLKFCKRKKNIKESRER